jgi:CheY-like chemotaxis protein
MAVRVAEDHGFEALSAASADEAIGILKSRSDVRLVFTDVNIPGSMNGLRLAHAVRGRWPPVELLVASALGDIRAKDLPDRGRFLAKPYDDAALSEAFQQMAGVYLGGLSLPYVHTTRSVPSACCTNTSEPGGFCLPKRDLPIDLGERAERVELERPE